MFRLREGEREKREKREGGRGEGGREGEEREKRERRGRRGREGGRGWSPYKLNYTPSYIGSLENLAVNQMLWVGIYIHFESPNYIVLYSLSHNVQWE